MKELLEVEAALIGKMMNHENALNLGLESLTSSDFLLPLHQDVFVAINALARNKVPLDESVIFLKMKEFGMSIDSISTIIKFKVYSGAEYETLKYYIDTILEASCLRAIENLAAVYKADAASGESHSSKILMNIMQDCTALLCRDASSVVRLMKESPQILYGDEHDFGHYAREQKAKGGNQPILEKGLMTGFERFDAYTKGLRPGLLFCCRRASWGW